MRQPKPWYLWTEEDSEGVMGGLKGQWWSCANQGLPVDEDGGDAGASAFQPASEGWTRTTPTSLDLVYNPWSLTHSYCFVVRTSNIHFLKNKLCDVAPSRRAEACGKVRVARSGPTGGLSPSGAALGVPVKPGPKWSLSTDRQGLTETVTKKRLSQLSGTQPRLPAGLRQDLQGPLVLLHLWVPSFMKR